jgi:hypothetical protein
MDKRNIQFHIETGSVSPYIGLIGGLSWEINRGFPLQRSGFLNPGWEADQD